jgi:predicted nucleic acid-binding protein
MLVLLDSGILLRLVNRADVLHKDVRAAVRALRARGDTLTVATQNIAEFWNVCTRPTSARGGLGLTIEETARKLRLVERLTQVVPDTPVAYPIWKQLVVRHGVSGVQVHDARLVALMTAQGIPQILTLNAPDFKRYSGIAAITPAELVAKISVEAESTVHYPVFVPMRNTSEVPLVRVNEEMSDCFPLFTSKELAERYVAEEASGMGVLPINDEAHLASFIARVSKEHSVRYYAINFTFKATSVRCGPISDLVK